MRAVVVVRGRDKGDTRYTQQVHEKGPVGIARGKNETEKERQCFRQRGTDRGKECYRRS